MPKQHVKLNSWKSQATLRLKSVAYKKSVSLPRQPVFDSTSLFLRIQGSGIGLKRNNHKIWCLTIKTPLRQNSLIISWKCLQWSFWNGPLYFLLEFSPVHPPLCNIHLTSLLNMFWAINQDWLFMSIPKKFAKLLRRKLWWSFSGKVVALQPPNLLKWNPTMSAFIRINEIIFWGIFQNSYYNNW